MVIETTAATVTTTISTTANGQAYGTLNVSPSSLAFTFLQGINLQTGTISIAKSVPNQAQ